MASSPKFVQASQLPRIKTRGLVRKFYEQLGIKPSYIYDAGLIGQTMENVYSTTGERSRYETAKSNMVSTDHFGDFTLNEIFILMKIREDVDECMAMEIAGLIQLYLPQRTFNKISITVNSKESDGTPVKKVLEVKQYCAYEADAVQWLVKSFFNRIDLIDEVHRELPTHVSPYTVLFVSKQHLPNREVIDTLFFSEDRLLNLNNHTTFQSEMTTLRFPSGHNIFNLNQIIENEFLDSFQSFYCAGIFAIYIERYANAFAFCS